jgi:undecaprenyl diphosphate synthase
MMPWQGAYAELLFSPNYFPDFGPLELGYALLDFSERSRRFGK